MPKFALLRNKRFIAQSKVINFLFVFMILRIGCQSYKKELRA